MANKYYYNDVILPGLPNTGSYSNHYIIQYSGATGYEDGYVLLATDAAAFYGSYGVETPASTNALAWICTDGKTWGDGGQYDVSDKYLTDLGTVVWTHYDIYYDDGGVYMEGSEPVLAVSEWAKMRALVRGIMTGLVSSGHLPESASETPVDPDEPIAPMGYLAFSSDEAFTIATKNATKNWDGTLYYSTDASTWSEWGGATAIASAEHSGKQRLYMRGVGNSKITGAANTTYRWALTGNMVRCDGNMKIFQAC